MSSESRRITTIIGFLFFRAASTLAPKFIMISNRPGELEPVGLFQAEHRLVELCDLRHVDGADASAPKGNAVSACALTETAAKATAARNSAALRIEKSPL